MGAVEKQVPLPREELDPLLERLRAWAEANGGKPVYMFSLMRFHRHAGRNRRSGKRR